MDYMVESIPIFFSISISFFHKNRIMNVQIQHKPKNNIQITDQHESKICILFHRIIFFNFPHVEIPWIEEATSGWKEMKREDQAGGLHRKKGPCRKRGFSQTPISMREIKDRSHNSEQRKTAT